MDAEKELEVFEAACRAYSKAAREMREGCCDKNAMVAAFLTIRHSIVLGIDKIIAVCPEEGGEWIEVAENRHPHRVHAIKFASGRVWDACNGWRGHETLWKPK